MATTFSSLYENFPLIKSREIISGMKFSEENKNPAKDFDLQEYQEFQKFRESRMQNVS